MPYADCTISEYLKEAASDEPTPGGGSVSALAGALASAMSEMAGNFTVGKDKYADVETDVRRCLKRLELSRQKLVTLADADANAYSGVGQAYSMPKETAEEKTARNDAIQHALREAMSVPLNIMRQCATIAETATELVEIANPNLLTDVGVSAVLAEAACAAARLNVEINLKFLEDEDLVSEVRPELDELSDRTVRCRETVSDRMQDHLSG